MKPCSWQEILKNSIEDPDTLSDLLGGEITNLSRVTDVYPMCINAYLIEQMRIFGTPISRQFIPDLREIEDNVGLPDPLAEEQYSPVPYVTHRYTDRVLFRISDDCASYCRFCTRKRLVGRGKGITDTAIKEGIRYIEDQPAVHDVLLSGGDPLLLSDERLDWILNRLFNIDHLDYVRIGTRTPSILPQRITEDLIKVVSKYSPLYIITHFNHPDEFTPEAKHALKVLGDAGIPLSNQTVLLRGVNDSSETMTELMRTLMSNRVRPYYLHQGDLTLGTDHFRTTIETGLYIMRQLRKRISSLAIPEYVIDLPRGGGKVPLTPEYILRSGEDAVEMSNFENKRFICPQPRMTIEKKGTYHALEV